MTFVGRSTGENAHLAATGERLPSVRRTSTFKPQRADVTRYAELDELRPGTSPATSRPPGTDASKEVWNASCFARSFLNVCPVKRVLSVSRQGAVGGRSQERP